MVEEEDAEEGAIQETEEIVEEEIEGEGADTYRLHTEEEEECEEGARGKEERKTVIREDEFEEIEDETEGG